MQALYRSVPMPWRNRVPLPVLVLFVLSLIAVLAELSRYSINNFLIFKQVFWHLVHQTNLYTPYPAEYEDTNHYGPFFGVLIAPFAILPTWLGVILWVLFNTAALFLALRSLPLKQQALLTALLIIAVEHMTASHNVQSNPLVAAWIIGAYSLVRRKNDFWAALLVVMGTAVKLYGIVGIVFFLFSDNRGQYLKGLLFWGLVVFAAPMLISSPAFVVQCYADWATSLLQKNEQNRELIFAHMQDISLIGMIRRIFYLPAFPALAVLVPAGLLSTVPLLRTRLYHNVSFQLHYLALVLIGVVIFSSSAESSTYVVAVSGVAIWYVLNRHRQLSWHVWLLVFVLVLTELSPTDLFPFPRAFKRAYVTNYALKALPCVLVWLVLAYQLIFHPPAQFQSPQTHAS